MYESHVGVVVLASARTLVGHILAMDMESPSGPVVDVGVCRYVLDDMLLFGSMGA